MKRLLSFLMVWIMLFSLFPAHVHGEEHTEPISDTDAVYFAEWADARDHLREAMAQRQASVTLKMPIERYSSGMLETMYNSALVIRTRWQTIPGNCYEKIDDGFVYLHYSFQYLTTAQQEAELASAVQALLAELQCDSEDSYGSAKKIYDWVCTNVAYIEDTGASLQDFTAYGAMTNRRATSQGFALLVYELLTAQGFSAWIVEGTAYGQYHLWNVFNLESKRERYYYLDAALDAGKTEQRWFLRGSEQFTDHTNAYEFLAENFDPVSRVCQKDYGKEDPVPVCSEHSRWDWWGGTCIEQYHCTRCGVESGEYGLHDFGISYPDCGRTRYCYRCQQVIPPQEHTYSEERGKTCAQCYRERTVTCVGKSQYLTFTDREGHQEPQISGLDGLPITLMDDYVADDGSHVWTYQISYEKIGTYTITVTYGSGQEPEQLDLTIFDHEYGENSRSCQYCNYVEEDRHVHDWGGYDCNTPYTCSECGQTKGEPMPHVFTTRDCMTEPAKCIYCGAVEDLPIGHKFISEKSPQCARCYQDVIYGCTEGGAYYGFSYDLAEDYRLINTDPRVSMEPYYGKIGNSYHSAKFELKATEPGRYEVTFERVGMNAPTTVTLVVSEHRYVDGFCEHCGGADETMHLHDWLPATCTEPKTCAGCGEGSGYALGHVLESGPCSEAKTCTRCQAIVEAPSHYYTERSGNKCVHCKRNLSVICEGVGLTLLLNSTQSGDFTMKTDSGDASLVLLEYFARNGVYYWEYMIYTPGPGFYDIDLSQKNSEEPLLLTVQVLPHIYFQGICLLCGSQEGEHIHTWKSATCKKPATCTECGETEGHRLDHDYGDSDCSKSAKCNRCGESRSKISHTYDDWQDDYCNRCNKLRIAYCREGTKHLILENQERDGYYLKNAPRGVKLERSYYTGKEDWYRHDLKLVVDNPDKGVYEMVFADYGGEHDYPFTLQIFGHDYVDNACIRCGKKEVAEHTHNWSRPDCYNPSYCTTCGETQDTPAPHDWEEATCAQAKRCTRCETLEGNPLPHDFVGLSCTQPGVCRNCNALQDKPFGHTYDSELDDRCNVCDQFRLLGCKDQVLELTVESPFDTPYTLVNPEQGISLTLENCVREGDRFLHTYRVSVPGNGPYELTAAQEGNPNVETFTVQLVEHQYADGFCIHCGGEFTGLLGDVDGNGKLDYNDALMVLRASVKLATLTSEQEALGDFDGNGKLDYNDALAILRTSIGL